MSRSKKKRSPGSDLDSVKAVLKLLSNDLRRNMIVSLAAKPMDVSNIAKKMGCSQSAARRNLNILVDADLLEVDQPNGKRIYGLGDAISVQKQRGKVMLKAEVPGGGSVAMKLNWPPGNG